MIPMDAREAREALMHARYRVEDAGVELQRAEAYYGRMYAAAAAVLSKKQLVEAGFPDPTVVAGLSTPAPRPPRLPTSVERLLHLDETAQMLGRSPSALRYMVHKGTAPPSAMIGGRRMFKHSEVQAWIDAKFAAGEREELTGMEHTLAAAEEQNPFRTTPRSQSAHRARYRPKG